MMDYKEMAEIVTKEVDAILERKRIRAMRIKRISLTASGLCAAVLVCFGVWKLRPSLENKNNFDDTNIVITTAATAETTEISTQTTPPPTTAAKTETTASAAKTTSISTKAVETKATAAVPIRTTVPYRTTVNSVTTRKATTTTASLTTVTLPVSTTATAAQTSTTAKVHATTASPTTGVFVVTTAPVTSTPTETTTPRGGITDPPPNKNTMTEIFLASTATVEIKKNGTYVNYEKHNTLIENENIGDFISLVSLKMIHPDGTRQILSMGVYTIKDVDMEEAVALRLVNEYSFTEGYYLFTDPNYQKNDN
ncbi:hypothetical protein SAMN02910265_01825 [Ruminococcus flavefaciens]|uniref:Uncharacterized protein n=1 Tax=Ruminococcus flavefaciens TaxID=1265 RepID=A0A1H6JNE7_RUMFL|nr:hypothetical protein [Ruminococcus flavefaciens]SEH62398.1 hypothetical protein SAMN02910265_01825 [Ruminococcus flavefaciens]